MKGAYDTRTGYRLGEAPQKFRAQHGLFLGRRVRGCQCQIAIGK